MTLVFGNMTLNVKIFSNPRPKEVEDEDVSSIDVVDDHGLGLICCEDPVEVTLTRLVTEDDFYSPQHREVRQICAILEKMGEEVAMGLWRE